MDEKTAFLAESLVKGPNARSGDLEQKWAIGEVL
jgi:hypothetical protein